MQKFSDCGLVALSETYALSRQELMLLRGLGGKVFETIRSLLPRLGISLGIALPSLRIAKVAEVLNTLPAGVVLTVRFGERAGGILAMSSALKVAAMQMVFAGSRRWSGAERLSDLELAAVGRMLGKAIADGFSAGFARLFGAQALPTGAFAVEMITAETLLAEDKVLCFSCAADGGGSAMIAAIELAPILALRGLLREAASLKPIEAESSAVAMRRIGRVKVEISAVLGTLATSFAELRTLKPGSCLPLGKLRDSVPTVDVYAGGQRLGTGIVVEDRGWRRIFLQQ